MFLNPKKHGREGRRQFVNLALALLPWLIPLSLVIYGLACPLRQHAKILVGYWSPMADATGPAAFLAGVSYIGAAVVLVFSDGPAPGTRTWRRRILYWVVAWGALAGAVWCHCQAYLLWRYAGSAP